MQYNEKMPGFCVEYSRDSTSNITNNTNIVIVSADVVGSRGFVEFIGGYFIDVVRVFIDEAHVMLLDVMYREKLSYIPGTLLEWDRPFTLLTGTLPPSYEDALNKQFLRRNPLEIKRFSTDRPNLGYIVQKVKPKTSLEDTVRPFLQGFREWLPPKRSIVFVKTKIESIELATALRKLFVELNFVSFNGKHVTYTPSCSLIQLCS